MGNKQFDIVINILRELNEKEVLNELVLIGSWVQIFYNNYFKDIDYKPVVKTLDIDFLIAHPTLIKKNIDIPGLLKKFNFIERLNLNTGWAKYVHPDLDLEFLTPKLGRGTEDIKYIKQLNVNAVSLRYLNLISDYTMKAKYEDVVVTVPEPPAFVLHKLIVCDRRLKATKREKDLETAARIGELIVKNKKRKQRLIEIYNDFPKGWQKTIHKLLKEHGMNWIG